MTRVLLVPGRSPAGPAHWMTPWAEAHPEYAGAVGHLNTASGHGPWPLGERLLAQLLAET